MKLIHSLPRKPLFMHRAVKASNLSPKTCNTTLDVPNSRIQETDQIF